MIHFDNWHTLTVGDYDLTLGGHDRCPSYPDGPEPGDTDYGCLTRSTMRHRAFPEIDELKPGEYLVRYWWTDDRDDGYAVKPR